MEASPLAVSAPYQLPLTDLGFAHVTPVGLHVYRPEPDWDQLVHAFEVLTMSHQADQWSLGDWWILASAVFGEDASQIVSASRIPRKTLQNYAWVCRKFLALVPLDEFEALRDLMPLTADPLDPLRRRMPISFSHHSAVAGLVGESEEATALAVGLLDRALVDPETSVEDFEEAVRQFRGPEEPAEEDEEGEDVSFKIGTVPARLERLHSSISNLRDELPKRGWRPERRLLSDAMTALETCLESVRNREAGGAPATR